MKGKKGSVDEGGVRVPFFIRWPGKIKPHTVVKQVAAHIDILPTLVALTGIPQPQTLPLDGKSLAPLLQGKTVAWTDRSIFTHVLKDTEKQIKPFPGAIRTAQYRYIRGDQTDQLYDMLTDPGQKTDIAAQHPDLMKTFRASYDKWFAEVTFKKIQPEITEIGYQQAPITELFAPDAAKEGALKYFAKNGFAHDWFTGWQQPADTATWKINVVNEGSFNVKLKYNCPDGFLGSAMQVSIDGKTVEKDVQIPFVGKLFPSPDRVTRIEAYEKDWTLLDLGELKLSKGIHKMVVSRTTGNPTSPFELKSVILQKL